MLLIDSLPPELYRMGRLKKWYLFLYIFCSLTVLLGKVAPSVASLRFKTLPIFLLIELSALTYKPFEVRRTRWSDNKFFPALWDGFISHSPLSSLQSLLAIYSMSWQIWTILGTIPRPHYPFSLNSIGRNWAGTSLEMEPRIYGTRCCWSFAGHLGRYETAGKTLWEVLKYTSDRSIMSVVHACKLQAPNPHFENIQV